MSTGRPIRILLAILGLDQHEAGAFAVARLLRDAGIEGSVVYEVVIGIDGHPEPESLRLVSSSNKAFERPARDVILGSVFRPGRMRGQPVRVLVRQPIAFQIIRR